MLSFPVLALIVCSALQILSAPQYQQYVPQQYQQSNGVQYQVPSVSQIQNNLPQVPGLNNIPKLPQAPTMSQIQDNMPQLPEVPQMPQTPSNQIPQDRPSNVPQEQAANRPQPQQAVQNIFTAGLNFLHDVSTGMSVNDAAARR